MAWHIRCLFVFVEFVDSGCCSIDFPGVWLWWLLLALYLLFGGFGVLPDYAGFACVYCGDFGWNLTCLCGLDWLIWLVLCCLMFMFIVFVGWLRCLGALVLYVAWFGGVCYLYCFMLFGWIGYCCGLACCVALWLRGFGVLGFVVRNLDGVMVIGLLVWRFLGFVFVAVMRFFSVEIRIVVCFCFVFLVVGFWFGIVFWVCVFVVYVLGCFVV